MPDPQQSGQLRELPSVDRLLERPEIQRWLERLPRAVVLCAIRSALQRARQRLRDGGSQVRDVRQLVDELLGAELTRWSRYRLRPVINATGIILHTGLGRAPLADEVAEHVAELARQYVSLELELASGRRGRRTELVRELLCALTGAEAATVVNNNAAATLIVLAAVAGGREVVVSRGELIEIGGSFRLPEIMSLSGARLREVGTTNKTRLEDYAAAIGEQTAALMKVHTSNYRIVGFTESVTVEELVALARQHELVVIDDIGSGALVDLARVGLAGEPVARRSIAAGADVVLFSGDKLLGGPQAGLIVGRQEWIVRIERHPLARAFRVDKLTLAALEATLRLYLDEEQLWDRVPVLRMAAEPADVVRRRAEALAEGLRAIKGVRSARVERDQAYLGGGSLPMQAIESWVVVLVATELSEQELARRLRTGEPAVVPRVRDGAVVLDARTMRADEVPLVVRAIEAAVAGHATQGSEVSGP